MCSQWPLPLSSSSTTPPSTLSSTRKSQCCDFTAHMCTGIILSIYKLFVNPLFKLISIEHVIIGSNGGKLCEDLIIHGSNYGFIGRRTAFCCSVSAANSHRCTANVLTKLVTRAHKWPLPSPTTPLSTPSSTDRLDRAATRKILQHVDVSWTPSV